MEQNSELGKIFICSLIPNFKKMETTPQSCLTNFSVKMGLHFREDQIQQEKKLRNDAEIHRTAGPAKKNYVIVVVVVVAYLNNKIL